MPLQDKMYFRIGQALTLVDGYGVVTTKTSDGNLTATLVGNVVDLGVAGQVPFGGLCFKANIPQVPVFGGTANATSYAIDIKLEYADTGAWPATLGTVRYTQNFGQIVTTNAAPKTLTVNGRTGTAPQLLMAKLAQVPHEFVRATITITATGGTAPTINLGGVSAWVDEIGEDHPSAVLRID